MDLPETEEEEPIKSQGKKEVAPVTRGANILNRVVASRDVGLKSAFTEEDLPPFGVLTDHEAELSKVCLDLLIILLFPFSDSVPLTH